MAKSQSAGLDLENESQIQLTFELSGIDLNIDKSFHRKVENIIYIYIFLVVMGGGGGLSMSGKILESIIS